MLLDGVVVAVVPGRITKHCDVGSTTSATNESARHNLERTILSRRPNKNLVVPVLSTVINKTFQLRKLARSDLLVYCRLCR